MDTSMDRKIAVVAMGALFPDAQNVDEFWRNIVSKRVSIAPLPDDLLERDVFYRPDLFTAINKQDKTITEIAGWIKDLDLQFDTVRKYKIPPSVAEHMDLNQHASLYTADQALETNTLKDVPNDRVAVILGNGMVGTSYGNALVRVQYYLIEHYLKKHAAFGRLSSQEQDEVIEYVRAKALPDSIPITEDSAPGVLPNIIAARIANVYDFHGPSFTIDAACASVLAAIIKGIQGLLLNEYDAVICGGADMPLKQLGFIYFSALNALSPDGSFPFDKRANGFVMGQGSGTVILKRLQDAIQHEDTIYAVITGYGESSDGKGKYIAAPNPEWQAHAIEKACRMARYPVDTVELIEAHGTATKVGDVVEVAALKRAFGNLGSTRKNYCGLTSVKSNIGHLKSAAGIPGLIKAVLAIHHKMLPPTANFQELNPKLELEDSPFYILDELREWEAQQAHPRRANVSAFGFGGADYHVALEEYREQDYGRPVFAGFSSQTAASTLQASAAQPGDVASTEILFFSAETPDDLEAQVKDFVSALKQRDDVPFAEYCSLHNYNVRADKRTRLALLAGSPADLESKFDFFTENKDKVGHELLKTKGVFYKQGKPITPEATAILFPGQASQYPDMFRAVYDRYDAVRTLYHRADAFWLARHGHTIRSLVFPTAGSEEAALERLRQTQNAHPSIFIASYALYQLLHAMGLTARYMIGHSLGEITALAAAGKVAFDDALELVGRRGYAFYGERLEDPGKMISVKGSIEQARALVQESGLDASIANINGPQQIIVAGSSPNVEQFKTLLDEKQVKNKLLFVSHAFHTALLQPVAERFYQHIRDISFQASDVQVTMNHAGTFYPNDPQKLSSIPHFLRDQIVQPVDFVGSVQKLYQAGVRLFVEVGPGAILSGLAKDILSDQAVTVLTSNYKSADDVTSLLKLYGALFAEGVPLKLVSPSPSSALVPLEIQHPAVKQPIQKRPVRPVPREDVSADARRVRVVYSGVAVGLPGSYKEAFRDDNFDQLFAGRNLIERLTDQERQRLVDLQISKLIKDETGPSFKLLSSLDDVIQLAGKIGKIDLIRDYHLDEQEVRNMSTCIAHGVAAGYEALRDAHIPLVREYVQTSTGRMLPQKLALPAHMQEETGVIFANGFPMIDPVIREVSRYVSHYYGSKTRKELMAFYESIIERVKDDAAKKLLTDWYALYYHRLSDNLGREEVYKFNFNFMNQISAQANNRLATLINAKGPNFQMNAACSSTSNAITIAEDFIRSGRVKRMIVIGADDATSETNLPLLGAGFLCTGAATNAGDLYQAALPFDRRRNGMIISAGAVGIVLETQGEVEKRGIAPVCELLGTHSFNTARHPSQIDADQFSSELDKFVTRMERERGLARDEMARQAIYISHETYTPPRGGCSQTEAEALRRTFGERFREIIVGNTKGMTGHAMGASLEDAVAAKALQYGRVPPVVNYAEPDPMLEGLNLSNGGRHDRAFALKMSAGFGSQGHFALLRKTCSGDERVVDRGRYMEWLKTVAADTDVATEQLGRLYVIKDKAALKGAAQASPAQIEPRRPPLPVEVTRTAPTPGATRDQVAHDKNALSDEIVVLISEVTGYPPEMLEPDMEFEADLGIDKEKRAIIQARLTAKYRLPTPVEPLSDEATIGDVIAQVLERGAQEARREPGVAPVSPAQLDKETVRTETLRVFAEVTKYPEDMLELDMEMEADLGIDTVKQATILSILGEKYQLEREEGMQLSDYPTIGHIVDLVYEKRGGGAPPVIEGAPVEESVRAEPEADVKEQLTRETLQVFAEVTKYPEDMLELDMEMEADLGIDTVKQATILSILGERYQLEREEGMQLSDYPTIGHIVDLVYEKGQAVERAPAQTVAAEKEVTDAAQPVRTRPTRETNLSRQVVVLVEEALGAKDFDLEDKAVWVLGDRDAVVEAIAAACERKRAHVRTFVFPRSTEDLEQAIADFAPDEAVDVIVDCSHIESVVPFDQLGAEEAREWLLLSSQARFMFFKTLLIKDPPPAKIIGLTAVDGHMGIDGARARVSDPTFGALSGFYKGLRKEWTDSEIRIVDFAPQAVANQLDVCIDHLLAEIEHAGIGVEIAYHQGKRMVVKIQDKALQTAQTLPFSENDTFLITGGGTGIASRVLLALAHEYPANFIIVDIVPWPQNIDTLAQLDESGLEQLKQEILERLTKTHTKVKPVMLRREYEKITKAIKVYRRVQEIESLGRRVVYISCDVRDGERLKAALERAREQIGPVTAIIHAAGIDRSHRIDQKSAQEFHDVFTVKAQGAYNLMDLCRDDPLKLVVTFSSISGRFGNAAQLDYCAANSFLNYWIKMIQHSRKDVHAVSMIWSGWKEVGIAWRNELVRRRSEEIGLNLIDVDQGVAAFMREIENRSGDLEVILHRGLDGFLERGLAAIHLPDYPLIDRVTTQRGKVDRAFRVFSVKRDALIDQHRLGKVPILPAVAYSELAVEYYAMQVGRQAHYVLRNLTFSNAFKLFHEAPRELFVQGRPADGDAWEIEIKSSFRPPKLAEAQIILHSRSTVSGELPDYDDMQPHDWTYDQATPTRLSAEESLLLIKGSGPEQRIILGPLYNDVLRESQFKEPVLIYPEGTTYPTYFPQEQLTNVKYPLESLLTNPCFLDSMYQACAAHLLVTQERVYLPWKVGELGIVQVPRREGLYKSHTRVVHTSDEIVGFDVVMVDGDGQICYFGRDVRFRKINL